MIDMKGTEAQGPEIEAALPVRTKHLCTISGRIQFVIKLKLQVSISFSIKIA